MAVCFIVGISGHRALPAQPLVWLITVATILLCAAIFLQRSLICSGLLAMAAMVCGAGSGQLAEYYFAPNDIGAFVGASPRLAWVRGKIVETPRIIESPPRGRKLPERQVFRVQVQAVRTWRGWISAEGIVPVSVSGVLPELTSGQRVSILGRLDHPLVAMNPGQFDRAEHDRRERIVATMHVSRPYDIEILTPASALSTPLASVRNWARGLLGHGFGADHQEDRALLAALVFGDREPRLQQVQDDFTHTGTAHLLAANGARVAILSGLVYLICRMLRVGPRRTLLTVTAATALLGLMTLPAAQAIRPVVVCLAIAVGVLGWRMTDSLQLLALAALAILVPQPLELYNAGFQLSFVIVLGMILFTPRLSALIRSFENRDKAIAKRFVRQSALSRAGQWLMRWAVQALAAALVAWVVALPLVSYHFQQLNLWTVPFGLLLSPLALLALLSGFAKVVLTGLCPPLAGAWAALSWPSALCLRYAVHWLAAVPGADVAASQPALWQILLFYLLLCAPLIPWPQRKARWSARFAAMSACGLLIALPLCGGFGTQSSLPDGARITVLSVGAGQCAVVEPAEGGPILLDAGSSSAFDPMATCIAPFLRYARQRSIDSIWLSHGDYDHISAVHELVPIFHVREVVSSPHLRRHASESEPCQSMLAMLDHAGHSPRLVWAGQRVALSRGLEIEVLWPPKDCAFNSNNSGLVLKLVCGGRSILFPADIQMPAEQELLREPWKLKADVLIAPHHGSGETTTEAFVRAVDPQLIISSNGPRLTQKQRNFETEIDARPLMRTNRCGAITIEVTYDGKIRVIPFRGSRPIELPAR